VLSERARLSTIFLALAQINFEVQLFELFLIHPCSIGHQAGRLCVLGKAMVSRMDDARSAASSDGQAPAQSPCGGAEF
jgi:hypothetical protein